MCLIKRKDISGIISRFENNKRKHFYPCERVYTTVVDIVTSSAANTGLSDSLLINVAVLQDTHPIIGDKLLSVQYEI